MKDCPIGRRGTVPAIFCQFQYAACVKVPQLITHALIHTRSHTQSPCFKITWDVCTVDDLRDVRTEFIEIACNT